MRPGYLAGRDPDGTLLAQHREKVQTALAGTGAMVIDAHAALEMPEDAFFDAYHLKRDRVERLTRYVGEQMITSTAQPKGHRPARPLTSAVSQAASHAR
jgi:hypothetical protein